MLPDVDTIAIYGGALSNYAPVEDPTTDEDAGSRNKYAGNVAMMTHTLCRALVRFVGNATAPADPSTGLVHDACWGNAPAVKPTPGRTSTGLYTFTWPATVNDELGTAHTLALRGGWVSVEGATPYLWTVSCSANVATVRIFNTSFALNDAVGVTFLVGVF